MSEPAGGAMTHRFAGNGSPPSVGRREVVGEPADADLVARLQEFTS